MEVQKPITVARAEFMADLASLINNSGLPSFIIEPIIKDTLYSVRAMAQKQLENDTKWYQEMIDAENE